MCGNDFLFAELLPEQPLVLLARLRQENHEAYCLMKAAMREQDRAAVRLNPWLRWG